MGIQLARKKKINLKLSLLYKLHKVPFFPTSEKRLKFYLDLSWIFSRLAHEQTFATPVSWNEKKLNNFLRDGIEPQSKVLDLGCGHGYIIKGILDLTSNITGIDYDISSIEAARNNIIHPDVQFVCADVFEYLDSNPDKRFDIILLSHILEHVENPGSFLKKLTSYSSRIYIEVPDFEATHLNLFREAVHSNLNYTDDDHVSEFDRAELKQLVEAAGLIVTAEEYRYGLIKFWCIKKS